MNWGELERDWQAASNVLRTYWPKLSGEDLEKVAGRRDQLVTTLCRVYGYDPEEAERSVAAFEKEVRFPGAVK